MLRAPLWSPFQRAAVLEPPVRPRRGTPRGASAGGGPRYADLVPCCDCQQRFRLYVSNANWYKDKGLTPASRCKHCRLYRALAKSVGDDPDALFAVADSARSYRELRNAYAAQHAPQLAALAAAKRATKEARVTLAGGKTAFRREERRATTLRKRTVLRQQRRADEAGWVAPTTPPPSPAKKKKKPAAASAKPPPKPKGPKQPKAGARTAPPRAAETARTAPAAQ